MNCSCPTILRTIGLLLFVTSGALILASVGLSLYSICLKLFAIRTTGIIQQIRETEDSDRTWYKPIFTVTVRDGIAYEIATTVSFSDCRWKIGDVIDVLYFEQFPRCATYNNFWALFFRPIFFGAFSIISYIIGYLVYGVGGEMMKSG